MLNEFFTRLDLWLASLLIGLAFGHVVTLWIVHQERRTRLVSKRLARMLHRVRNRQRQQWMFVSVSTSKQREIAPLDPGDVVHTVSLS